MWDPSIQYEDQSTAVLLIELWCTGPLASGILHPFTLSAVAREMHEFVN